ncbi:hypothetical protein [Cellulomonas sp. Leaf334]|uniref:hypothetical protein n=1 Tax=Cellulomonas sp. Leaf334 TaxID=1736339 RepID=UPI0006FF83C7|nr:hypothetical protein [Cellulomonas sp. Leaf334]KQR17288.1 hypothetical protein ASF78_08325 [Cellulomonas sp. Leaf334]
MTDLTTLMSRATATVDATPAAVLDDDVSRGQRARRRRTRLVGTGVAAVLAAAVAVGAPLTSTIPSAAAAELVTYRAEQPAGFTIAEVPEGWHVLSSDRSNMMLGDVDDDGSDPNSFEGRIVASLVSSGSLPGDDLEAQTFAVGGQEVLVYELLGADGEPGGTLGVFVPEGDGDYLSVQLPPELHWTGDVAARFAEGLDVTDEADHTVG